MHIKQELPLFENKKSLLIVTGKSVAKFYLALDKEIELIEEFEMPKPSTQYTDREGHFKRSGATEGYIGSGSVHEADKEHFANKFSSELAEKAGLLDKEKEPKEIYLFTPDYMKNKIKEDLGASLKKKIVMEITGNYSENHIFDLLKKIKEENESKNPEKPISKEARDLMNKGKF